MFIFYPYSFENTQPSPSTNTTVNSCTQSSPYLSFYSTFSQVNLASSCADPSAHSLPRELHYTGITQSNKATCLIKYHYFHSVNGESQLLTSHSHCKYKGRAPGFFSSHHQHQFNNRTTFLLILWKRQQRKKQVSYTHKISISSDFHFYIEAD